MACLWAMIIDIRFTLWERSNDNSHKIIPNTASVGRHISKSEMNAFSLFSKNVMDPSFWMKGYQNFVISTADARTSDKNRIELESKYVSKINIIETVIPIYWKTIFLKERLTQLVHRLVLWWNDEISPFSCAILIPTMQKIQYQTHLRQSFYFGQRAVWTHSGYRSYEEKRCVSCMKLSICSFPLVHSKTCRTKRSEDNF